MRIRYLSYVGLAIAAVFLVVATTVWAGTTVVELSLAAGIVMLIVSLGVATRFWDDVPSLFIGGLGALVSAWIIVASQVFTAATVDNVSFYSAIAMGALALLGLSAHELRAERVVHSLEIRSDERQPDRAVDGRPLAA